MGANLAGRFPLAREFFEEADDTLGFSLSRLCWEGPEHELLLTKNAQPAILVHSLAVWRLVSDSLGEVSLAAGHSLGEFTAYAAAGSLTFADAVRTVRLRGELMFRVGEERPGTMTALIGLGQGEAESICREASGGGGVAVPANFNAPGQVVISGDPAALGRAGEAAREQGARRVIPLNVSGAFHSPLMEPARAGLSDWLDGVAFDPPAFPVVSNVTARPVSDPAQARSLLVEQLTAPVRWSDSMLAMSESGAGRFLEIGPGSVLSGLLRRIDKGVSVKTLGTAHEVTAFLEQGGASWS